MTFGVRPSCVATERCGSSLARLEIQCLHQERNTTCVSPCLSNSSAVGPGGGFRALATGVSSLSCITGSADAGISCLVSSIAGLPAICSTCSTGCSRLNAIIRCTFPESALGRSTQNVRFSRFSSMLPAGFDGVSSQTQAPCGENTTVIPPSFFEDTAATGPSTSVTWYVIPTMLS